MPLSRYQIRNEYSLADPELYRTADKDDPEALLEGIAMAGLVGVLRQLGDLAEFAAEIFHDLHEQVMATASRGHGLMVRVQQLEAEFPMIEKAFLSQTTHSAFYYNTGTDWHPNLHTDQNVITQGDLPRFVMDSYEECRGPPRLFLLDKFDVAGAGACLKRYTDPSFFKLETSHLDTFRDKKIRKVKRKGPRWKNGETPETLSTSHAKLHQLFLQERIENGTLNSAGRVKLKRRLNGFPFNTKSGKSYMEKFLKPPTPDHDEVYVIPEGLSPPRMPQNLTYESTCEVVEISVVSPDNKPKQLMRSPSLSPAREETTQELAADEFNEALSSGEGSVEVPMPKLQAYELSPTSNLVSRENDIPVDGGSKTEGIIDDNESDDVASEIDDFVDALATMDSDVETDSELRSKTDLQSVSSRGQASNVDDTNDQKDQGHSAESVSTGNSMLSDDGSSSSKEELSSFSYSNAYSTSAENIPFDGEVSSNALPSDIHEGESSPIRQSVDPERELSLPVEDTASDRASTEAIEVPDKGFELDVPKGSSSPKDSVLVSENGEAVMQYTAQEISQREDLEVASAADVSEHKEDSLPTKSAEISDDYENEDSFKIGNIGLTSSLSVPSVSRNGLPWRVQSGKQFVDESDDETSTQDDNAVGSTEEGNLSSSNAEMEPLYELLDEEKAMSCTNRSDILVYNGDEVSQTISSENLPLNGFDVEGLSYDEKISVAASDIMEAGTDNQVSENLLRNSDLEDKSLDDVEGSQNSDLCLSGHQSNPMNKLGLHCSGIELDKQVSEVDGSIASEDAPIFYESFESRNPGTEANVLSFDMGEDQTLQVECCDKPLNVGDEETVTDKTASCSGLIVSGITNGSSLSAEVHEHLNELEDESATATATVADPDHENVGFPLDDLQELQEESLSCFREEHSALEVDTSSANMAVDSSVFDDVKNLHYTVIGDNIESQICENGVHLFSGTESGLNINDMPSTEKLSSASLDNLEVAVIHGNLESQICDGDNKHLVAGADYGWNIVETPTTQNLTSGSMTNLHDTVSDDHQGSQICEDVRQVSGGESEQNIDYTQTPRPFEEQDEQDPHHVEEDIDLQQIQMGTEIHCKSGDSLLSTGLQQPHVSDHGNHLRTCESSGFLVKNTAHKSSASEQLSQGNNEVDIAEPYLGPPDPTSLRFPVLPDSAQVYLEEMPPLPPLPPVQWRMGKFQNTSPAHESIMGSSSANTAFPPLLSSSLVNQEAHDLNLLLPQSVLLDPKSTSLSEQFIHSIDDSCLSKVPLVVESGEQKEDILPLERFQVTGALPLSSGTQSEMEGGELKPHMDSFDKTCVTDVSFSEFVKPHDQTFPETNASNMEFSAGSGESNMEFSAGSGENLTTSIIPEISVNGPIGSVIPTSDEHLSRPSAEDGMVNGNRTMKLPRPRNPLIDAVVALDKSKLRKVPERIKPKVEKEDERDSLLQLRKVPERIKPQVQKDDERDSLLEQIRTKSFNLKPAVVTRPSIHQGPNTNLRVAAILEKAKTIRQAFAGSDEDDDDDSWSDS